MFSHSLCVDPVGARVISRAVSDRPSFLDGLLHGRPASPVQHAAVFMQEEEEEEVT